MKVSKGRKGLHRITELSPGSSYAMTDQKYFSFAQECEISLEWLIKKDFVSCTRLNGFVHSDGGWIVILGNDLNMK